MKRTLIALGLGLVCGVCAHLLWFGLRHPQPIGDFDSQLAWMKKDLHLNSAQLARIRSLHQESKPRMVALAREVARMRREFEVIEDQRQKEGMIDFLKVSRVAMEQRVIDNECMDSARELVAATAAVLNPRQRDQYLSLLSPAMQAAADGAFN